MKSVIRKLTSIAIAGSLMVALGGCKGETIDNKFEDIIKVEKPVIYMYPEVDNTKVNLSLVLIDDNEVEFAYPELDDIMWNCTVDTNSEITVNYYKSKEIIDYVLVQEEIEEAKENVEDTEDESELQIDEWAEEVEDTEEEKEPVIELKDNETIIDGKKYEIVTRQEAVLDKSVKTRSLFWEAEIIGLENENWQYCIAKDETIKFLEDKLKELGLNDIESSDFIQYWAPRLMENEYNLISFNSNYKDFAYYSWMINDGQGETKWEPDTFIRVFMVYIPSKEKVKTHPVKHIAPKRKGFTAVEWGGALIAQG